MKTGLQSIQLRFLRHKNWLNSEMRVMLNKKKIDQYASEKKKGALFPPPVVFVDPEEIYHIGDGFHRIEADFINGLTKIEIDLRNGMLKDAILHNIKANREGQGLLFSSGDLSKSVKVLLQSKDFKGWTRLKIAETFGCNPTLVSNVARRLGMPLQNRQPEPAIIDQVVQLLDSGLSHKEVAKKLGIAERTTYRHEVRAHFEICPTCGGSGKIKKNQNVA